MPERPVNAENPLTENDVGKMVRLWNGETGTLKAGKLNAYPFSVDGVQTVRGLNFRSDGRHCDEPSCRVHIIAVLDPATPQPTPSEPPKEKTNREKLEEIAKERLPRERFVAAFLARHESSRIKELEAANEELTKENERLKRGDFTPEEFQNLCHNRQDSPGCNVGEFFEGCHEHQKKLFGISDREMLMNRVQRMEAENEFCRSIVHRMSPAAEVAMAEAAVKCGRYLLEAQLSDANAEIALLKRHYEEAVGLVTEFQRYHQPEIMVSKATEMAFRHKAERGGEERT